MVEYIYTMPISKIDKYMIPIVDNKYEKFDIENFQKKSVRDT